MYSNLRMRAHCQSTAGATSLPKWVAWGTTILNLAPTWKHAGSSLRKRALASRRKYKRRCRVSLYQAASLSKIGRSGKYHATGIPEESLDPFCTKGSALPYEVFTEHLGSNRAPTVLESPPLHWSGGGSPRFVPVPQSNDVTLKRSAQSHQCSCSKAQRPKQNLCSVLWSSW